MSHSELDAIVDPYSIVASNTSGGDYPNQQSQWHNQTTAAAAAVPEQSGGNETLMVLQFYEETRAFERQVGIIIPSIFAVFAFFGLIGNLLVVIVALNRQMRNSTNTLIIGLTCSDLMFLTLCIPFTAIDYAFPQWVLPTWMCPLINYLQHSSAYFSVWTLTLMAADRFLAVVFPVESMTLRTPKNTFFVLVVVYSVILVSQIQVGRIHAVYNYTFIMEERSACSIVSITKGEATVAEARLYFFSFNVFGYCLPLGITCVLYYFMLKRLWYAPLMSGGGGSSTKCSSMLSTNANNSANSSLRSRPETIRAKRKVTRLVLCVVIIWAVCWLPLNLCFFASGLIYPDTLVLRGGKPIVIVQICSQVLAYCNSTLNPILYPLVSENFRKGFLRVLCCMANWLSCGRCCKQFQVYNARMELTMLNRTNSNKSRQISRSNSKSNSTKTTQNQMREQTAQSEPSMLSLLHRQSLKRCSAVSIQGANGNARLRLLSRGESASFLTVGGGHHNGDLHSKYSSSLLIQLPPHPHQQQLQQQRRMSRISAPLYDPYHHRPSQHSLLSMRRTNLSGEDVSVVAEEEKSGERDQETGAVGNGRMLGDGGEKNGTGGAEKESLATGGRRRKDSTSCRDCGTEQYRFEEGDQQI